MPDTSDYNQAASTFTIAEQSGDRRGLYLRGRALPYRPFSLSGSQRNSVEWYPGNPIGVLQVYGAKEETTTINGWWKDVFLGEGGHPAYAQLVTDNGNISGVTTSKAGISTARELADVVDDIRRKGQTIQVTWFSAIRFGIISRFDQKWHTGHDLEYSIEFTWIAQDNASLTRVPFTNSIPTSDLPDSPVVLQAITDQIDPASGGFSTAFDPSVQDAIDAIDTGNATLTDLVGDLADSISQISQYATTSGDAQRRIVGVLDGIKIQASTTRDVYGGAADGARLNLGGGFGLVLSDRSTIRQQAAVVDSAAVLAAQQQKQLIVSLTSKVLAVFQAREGDDLRKVARIYYGTADDWQSLMLYNGLDDDELSAGQIVIVPASPALAAS